MISLSDQAGPDLSLRAETERGREDCVLSAGEWKALKKLRGMHLTMTLPTSDARIVPISEYTSWFGKYNVRYFTLFFVRASARTRFIYGGTARSQPSTPLLPYPYNSLRVTESFSISIHPSCEILFLSLHPILRYVLSRLFVNFLHSRVLDISIASLQQKQYHRLCNRIARISLVYMVELCRKHSRARGLLRSCDSWTRGEIAA